MNTFAVIEKLEEFAFELVNYYSVRFLGNDVNEFYDFLNRMEDEPSVSDDLNNLFIWLEKIGAEEGAKKDFFRNEAIRSDASALPPPRKQMEIYELMVENLRLYCLRANEHVVFLFNGGIKSQEIIEARLSKCGTIS